MRFTFSYKCRIWICNRFNDSAHTSLVTCLFHQSPSAHESHLSLTILASAPGQQKIGGDMGLERDLFLSPPDANLVCDLCNDVMDNPTTACGEGHTFCGPCLANAMGVPPPKTGTSWNHTWLAASTTRW